jgi:hypothetical protein
VQPRFNATGFTLLPLLNLQKIKRLVVIAVNAGSTSPADIDTKEALPNLAKLIASLLASSGDNYSFESMQLLLDIKHGREGTGTAYYPVQISFPLIHDAARRELLQGIGTNFSGLTAEQLNAIRASARDLLRQDPNFQRLLNDLQSAKGQ